MAMNKPSKQEVPLINNKLFETITCFEWIGIVFITLGSDFFDIFTTITPF